MSNLVPASWRETVSDLRDRVSGVFDRWLPGRAERAPTALQPEWPRFPVSVSGPKVDVEETDDEVLPNYGDTILNSCDACALRRDEKAEVSVVSPQLARNSPGRGVSTCRGFCG